MKEPWPVFPRWGNRDGNVWERFLWWLDDFVERVEFSISEWKRRRA